ncbi:MAG: hypothetical protein V4568_01970 [Pseudomonadota bacterium]
MSTVRQNFSNATPSLTGSMFSLHDFNEARKFFQIIFDRYVPGWEHNPVGLMGELWKSEGEPAIERLIDIARVIYDLDRGISRESMPALEHKVKQLLNCKDRDQFEELFTEMRIGAFLAVHAGTILCEPLAQPLNYKSRKQPPSPDFGIILPGWDALIEVTTLKVGALDDWDHALTIIKKRLEAAVNKAGLMKEIEIRAPLSVRAHELTKQGLISLIDKMRQEPDGLTEIKLGPATAKIIWRQVVVVNLPAGAIERDGFPIVPRPTKEHFGAIVAEGVTVLSAFASRVVPILDPNPEELFVASIRNVLKGKRKQFPDEIKNPSILIIQPRALHLSPDYLRYLIVERIWPKLDYDWLTGIGVFQSNSTYSYGVNAPRPKVTITWNPKAEVPRTKALHDLFENNVYFINGERIDTPQ